MLCFRKPALLGLVLCVGAAAAQDSGFIDRVQLGDNDLDCGQIAAQVKELDAILEPHKGDQGAVRGAAETVTRTRTGEVVAGVAKMLPFGSIFGDIAKDVLGRRGKEAEARVASVRARKEYLVEMFLKRDCRVAALSASKDKPTGAFAAGATVPPAADVAVGTDAAVSASSPQALPADQTSTQTPNQPPAQSGPPQAASVPAATRASEPAAPAAIPATPAAPRGPLFVLDFRLAFRTSADADGAAGAPGLELGGVPLTAMQAITDDAYVALLKDLAAAGFEVLNPELTTAAPRRGSLPAPARSGDYLYFAPSGAPLAQAPAVTVPGSDAALAETRTALAQAVTGRKPGVSFAIGVWYVDFARIKGDAEDSKQHELETRLAVAAGSHLALVEPGEADETSARAVRVLNLGRDLVSREPYGQVRLPAAGGALELRADPERFRTLVERQLKRARSALIGSLPPPAAVDEAPTQKIEQLKMSPSSADQPGAAAP